MSDQQPFLPFFVGDFLGATVLWGGEERALYMLMLAYQWSGGALPSNLKRLSLALGYPYEKFVELWATVKSKYRVDGEVLLNERLERHREKTIELSQARSTAGSVGGKASAAKRAALKAVGNQPLAQASDTPIDQATVEATVESCLPVAKANVQAKSKQISTILSYPLHPNPLREEIHSDQSARTGNESELSELKTGREGKVDEPDPMVRIARIRAAYPLRAGRTDWDRAEHFCNVLIERHNQTWDSLEASVRRYATYCDATRSTRTQHVLMPGNFFSAPDKPWSQEWALPDAQDGSSVSPVLTWRPDPADDESEVRNASR